MHSRDITAEMSTVPGRGWVGGTSIQKEMGIVVVSLRAINFGSLKVF